MSKETKVYVDHPFFVFAGLGSLLLALIGLATDYIYYEALGIPILEFAGLQDLGVAALDAVLIYLLLAALALVILGILAINLIALGYLLAAVVVTLGWAKLLWQRARGHGAAAKSVATRHSFVTVAKRVIGAFHRTLRSLAGFLVPGSQVIYLTALVLAVALGAVIRIGQAEALLNSAGTPSHTGSVRSVVMPWVGRLASPIQQYLPPTQTATVSVRLRRSIDVGPGSTTLLSNWHLLGGTASHVFLMPVAGTGPTVPVEPGPLVLPRSEVLAMGLNQEWGPDHDLDEQLEKFDRSLDYLAMALIDGGSPSRLRRIHDETYAEFLRLSQALPDMHRQRTESLLDRAAIHTALDPAWNNTADWVLQNCSQVDAPDLRFQSGSASLDPQDANHNEQAIEYLGRFLSAQPKSEEITNWLVGFSDPNGSATSNLQLSLSRAATVSAALSARFSTGPIGTLGKGEWVFEPADLALSRSVRLFQCETPIRTFEGTASDDPVKHSETESIPSNYTDGRKTT